MFVIRIDIDARKVTDHLGKTIRRIPKISERIAKEIAEEYANSIRLIIKAGAFEYPRGYLEKTIRAKPIKRQKRIYSYGVWAARYAGYVEKGRGPGKAPPMSQPIRRWARLAGLNVWALRTMIARYGTQPHPFIRPGVNKAEPKIKEIIRRNFKP